MVPVTESEMRGFVRSIVAPSPLPLGSMIVEEFVVGEGGRIDLAWIGDHLAGFELKSDLDSLARLPRQMDVYGEVFDFCTLVVTRRHLARARQILRPRWGLALVARETPEVLRYRQVRRARSMKSVSQRALTNLLWRDELVRALDELGAASGVRSKSRDLLCDRLAYVTDIDQLRRIVSGAITARQGWRDVRVPRARDGRFPPASVSSGFLARRLQSQRRVSAGLPG